jgi:hypothetical protein
MDRNLQNKDPDLFSIVAGILSTSVKFGYMDVNCNSNNSKDGDRNGTPDS